MLVILKTLIISCSIELPVDGLVFFTLTSARYDRCDKFRSLLVGTMLHKRKETLANVRQEQVWHGKLPFTGLPISRVRLIPRCGATPKMVHEAILHKSTNFHVEGLLYPLKPLQVDVRMIDVDLLL